MKENWIKRFLKKLFVTFIFGGIFLGIVGIGIITYLSVDLPTLNKLDEYSPPIPSKIYSKDGELLLNLGKEKRELVQVEDIPDYIIKAFLAAEDANFYHHIGVDFMGILRALIIDIKAGKIVQGGSTITQQVAKMLLLDHERSVLRKLKDIILALKIEQSYSKKEILYLYLNHIYLGGGYYGVKAAFKGYFDKELENVTVAESALLAGLLVAPGRYNPYLRPKQAKKRQNYVLGQMRDKEFISTDSYNVAIKEEIKIRMRRPSDVKAPYYVDMIRQKLKSEYDENFFLVKGLSIYTPLDWKLQQVAEKVLSEGVDEIGKRQGFKGTLGKISEGDFEDYLREQREKILEKNSLYFSLRINGEKRYEIEFEKEYFDWLLSEYSLLDSNKKLGQSFIVGNRDKKLPVYFHKDAVFDALVLGVDDKSKHVFVSVGGVRGVIPEENLSWAYKDFSYDSVRTNPRGLKQPSGIVSRGDLVKVKFLDSKKKVSEVLPQGDYKELPARLKNDEYYLFDLTQDFDVQGALVAIDPKTGEIVSLVGGKNFSESQFNRAIQSVRQTGSAFKPIIFAAAIEDGVTLADIIMDSPEALGGVDDFFQWKPKNYDNTFRGPMTVRRSFELSRNIPTIKLASRVGIPKIKELLRRFDIKMDLDDNLTMALGSGGLSPLDMTRMYGVFLNGGQRVYPKVINRMVDRNGSPMDFSPYVTAMPKEELENLQAYDERHAYLMSMLFKGVIQNGSGRRAKALGPYVGGKTGTTNSYNDAWFVGFASDYVIGVWVGRDNNKTLGYGEAGSKAALPIWKEFAQAAINLHGNREIPIPKGIVHVLIDSETGTLATETSETPLREAFVKGTSPNDTKTVENLDVDENIPLDDGEFFKTL